MSASPRAKLTSGQTTAAVLAGVFGHLFFALGLFIFGMEFLIGMWFVVYFLGTPILEMLSAMFGEIVIVGSFFWEANGVVDGRVILFGGVALAFIGVLISALILRVGQVRRPWSTTWRAVGIAAIADVLLLLVCALIFPGNDHPGFFVMAIIGTFAVGILVWLGVTRRSGGSAFEVAGPSTTASGAAAVAATDHAETTSAETTRSTT